MAAPFKEVSAPLVVFRLPGVVLGDAGSVGGNRPAGGIGKRGRRSAPTAAVDVKPLAVYRFLYVLLLKTVRQVSPFIVLVPELPLNVTLLTFPIGVYSETYASCTVPTE